MNPFHVEEFDGDQLTGLVARHDFRDVVLTAVLDGTGTALDQELMQQQDPSTWSTALRERVSRASVGDFPIVASIPADDPDQRVLDLIVTARADTH